MPVELDNEQNAMVLQKYREDIPRQGKLRTVVIQLGQGMDTESVKARIDYLGQEDETEDRELRVHLRVNDVIKDWWKKRRDAGYEASLSFSYGSGRFMM